MIDQNTIIPFFAECNFEKAGVAVLLLVPGPPTFLMLDSPSETEMTLHWTPPDQPNGILIGYLLQYQQSETCLPLSHKTTNIRHRNSSV